MLDLTGFDTVMTDGSSVIRVMTCDCVYEYRGGVVHKRWVYREHCVTSIKGERLSVRKWITYDIEQIYKRYCLSFLKSAYVQI